MGKWVLTLLLSGVCAATAQVGAIVAGQITDRTKSVPLPGATVTATLLARRSTTVTTQTDQEGKYLFPELDAGTYRIMATAPGYENLAFGAAAGGQAGRFVMLGPGETRLDVNIALRAQAVITGVVTDEKGEPVPNAQVSFLRYIRDRGRLRPIQSSQAITDQKGRYRAFGLNPGKYQVMAMAENLQQQSPQPQAYAVSYYPDASTPAEAKWIVAASGSETSGIDFRLRKLPMVAVNGRVEFPAGVQWNAPLDIAVMPDSPMGWGTGVRASGSGLPFSIPALRQGRYLMSATVQLNGRLYRGEQSIDVGPDGLQDVVLTMQAAVDLPGSFVLEGGSIEGQQPVVRLNPADPRVYTAPAASPVQAGSFVLRNVTPGVWDLDVTPLPRDGYLKGVWLGDKDYLYKEIPVAAGSPGKLKIVVSAKGARVEGDIDLSEADVGRQFSVLLAPTGAHSAVSSLYSSEDTTPDGHFIFDGLPPGSYKLYALEELDPRLVGDPELLRSLDDYGKDVELQEGGSLRLTDKLPIIRVSQLPPD